MPVTPSDRRTHTQGTSKLLCCSRSLLPSICYGSVHTASFLFLLPEPAAAGAHLLVSCGHFAPAFGARLGSSRWRGCADHARWRSVAATIHRDATRMWVGGRHRDHCRIQLIEVRRRAESSSRRFGTGDLTSSRRDRMRVGRRATYVPRGTHTWFDIDHVSPGRHTLARDRTRCSGALATFARKPSRRGASKQNSRCL